MRAGLHRVAIEPDELPEEFALRVLRKAAMDGDVFLLLGHLLLPAEREGKEWTPEMAQETADFIANVTDQRDKAIINSQIASVLMGFFANGLSSLIRSQNFSQRVEPDTTRIAGQKTMETGA
jgi:hypothetical protein